MIPFICAIHRPGYTSAKHLLPECVSCEVTEELNGEYTAAIEIPTKYIRSVVSDIMAEIGANDTQKREYLYDMVIFCKPNNGVSVPQPFRIQSFTEGRNITTIHAGHISYDLNYTAMTGLSVPASQGSINYIVSFFNANQEAWTAGINNFTMYTNITSTFSAALDAMYITVRELCKNIFTKPEYGSAEILWEDFDVTMLARRGVTRSYMLRRGMDYTIDERSQDASGCYNYILPYYRYDQTVNNVAIEQSASASFKSATSYISMLRRAKSLPVDFSNEIGNTKTGTAAMNQLNAVGQEHINNNAKLFNETYSVILHIDDESAKTLQIGDTVTMDDILMDGTSGIVRISKLTYDALRERTMAIDIGTPSRRVGDIIWTR